MKYDDPQRGREVTERVRTFVKEEVIPVERELLGDGPVSDETVDKLREKASDYDVYAPQIPEEYGGMGMGFREVLPVFEAAGRSLLGATAIRVDAPDEGNMHTLELVGTDEQKERWLEPLVEGDIKSGFSMTEPQPGAGSDPKMIRTTAKKDGDEWVIDGHKWWTTQGTEADVLLVMARTDEDAHPYQGCSLFLVPADAPGVRVERDIPHVGGELTGIGHAEIRYESVRVPEENLLGAENAGFAITQQRLGPARLTHCMRFSGMAERALDVAKAYADERRAFEGTLSDKQAIRFDVADIETRLHAARSMVRHAAHRIASGEQARVEVAMSKVFTADVAQDAIDTAVQICGGNGIGKDLPLADFYENVRQFRIIDGADEVHKRVIARRAFKDTDPSEVEHVARFRGE
ncbi:acyl-CoA dehydrogenase (plasmid) [Haloferax mediterranei ATCC 33500]|uniref:Acyl-CoA dehydrogenase n=1 Tax=Haloferax mediterranei (strain ATCC 33500 / DSM 1411 / JCM 8866 / NBRC 14739 / NCIMB 2177 / R-4) TaxID=523841 RepID=I3R8Z8_HALMT|nr:acyl-CoA dehydrogenase family protein [Haloferax mediterranei]AFK20708.1 acyl-CoA dehydrogenase [Haloferax mediterranei ATCC 33500]AHZ24035.1 acyl-CoA dehydrogenase [Haloferax mediterranei ATCC 33500]ELZ97621.1 acyl-CoA dehydrogenase [Haloferax mediterranei ATCC 33500]MDX5989708.1 acyl-CoA dehydrogenase family protein [Haloferax mediterranei ATCC 33500]QCQ77393.1 acyl-CoA dehydrogenase [Haloferax mediterranei ATCC 33500]